MPVEVKGLNKYLGKNSCNFVFKKKVDLPDERKICDVR